MDFPSAARQMGSPPSLRRQLASTVILVPRVPDHGVMFRAEIAGAIWMIYSGNLDAKGIVARPAGREEDVAASFVVISEVVIRCSEVHPLVLYKLYHALILSHRSPGVYFIYDDLIFHARRVGR